VERSPLQLVEDVLSGRLFWKVAFLALERLEPDLASARCVIEAHDRGVCEPWLAACLLGAIRHPDGYATALAILRSSPDVRAKPHAGPALTRIRGDAALADLAAVLEEATFDRSTHEGAAYGLAGIADPRALDVLLAALETERIRMSTAGSVVNELTLDPALLVGWLRGKQPRRRATAAWAVFYRSASDDRIISAELRGAVLAELDRGGLPFTAAQEEMLRERLAHPVASLPTAWIVKR
jgi:hypothetical protein